MSVQLAIILVGVILIFLSSVPITVGVNLWNLGWGFVLLGLLIIGKWNVS